jgi:hypothetical protein
MLTKTLFRLAMECPVKVHYVKDPRYANTRMDDEFLEALAKGGHQVGALAKTMHLAKDPEAVEVVTRDRAEQLAQTRELLARDSVTVFEGTAQFDELLIRADVLVKRGRIVDLIEVKAKSWMPGEDSLIGLTPRSLPVNPDWEPYVYDLAFQHHVLSEAYPALEFRPWFLFVDKSRVNPVPGLATKFRPVGEARDVVIEVDPEFDVEALEPPLLVQVDASEAVRLAETTVRKRSGRPDLVFHPLIEATAGALATGTRPAPQLSTVCKSCEFYCAPGERTPERRSGWAECMETHFGLPVENPREESIFGFYRRAPIHDFVGAGHLWMRQLTEENLPDNGEAPEISQAERQRLQWREIKHGEERVGIRRDPLRLAISEWEYPLHFIDFETAAPALPFHAGMRPYQYVLFQFSHHTVDADGRITHAHECLEVEGDESPGIAVVRRLRDAIGHDVGTVLHWYDHERTVLRSVRKEIEVVAPADADDLLAFLDELGLERGNPKRLRDLGRLMERLVFLPGTGGSSSMKRVLPAIIQLSDFVRNKYSRPIYGTAAFPSLNFSEQPWVIQADGQYLDPYKLLAPMFRDRDIAAAIETLEELEGEFVANGAAAMIAYGTLQDPRLPESEKAELKAQLKRYCELDTLAMVMVYEALREWLQ